MDYNAFRIATTEHQQMVRSIPAVPEYGSRVFEQKSTKWSRPVLWVRPILATVLHFVTK
jgi:cytochrome c-type biogenesis protein CcmH/NrfF